MQVSHNMAFCLAISIIVHHTIIQMFWAHDFWNNGPNTANRQRLDIKQTQWTVIDCVYFKKPWFDERFWHIPNSFTCQYSYFTFLSSSPLYLVLLQNTGLKFRKKTPRMQPHYFHPLILCQRVIPQSCEIMRHRDRRLTAMATPVPIQSHIAFSQWIVHFKWLRQTLPGIPYVRGGCTC